MRDTFVRQLQTLAQADPRIFLITGDLGFGVLTDFAKRFPRQFLNVGVAEQNMTGVATGLALEGRVVFTYSIGNFPTLRCLEQIRNDACYHNANVKVVSVGGGFSYGQLGMSHHATEDLAILRTLPGMIVVAPGDGWETQEATKAIASRPGTAYLRLDKSKATETRRPNEEFQLGRARCVRQGYDLTIVSTGGILGVALDAAEALSTRGVHCRVLSMHTLKPLDERAVCAAATETGGIVSLEEHSLIGGLGSSIAETCLDSGISPRRFARIGLHDEYPSVVGTQQYLRCVYGLDVECVVSRIMALVRGTNGVGLTRGATAASELGN